jgi:hypothetical protein
MKEKKLLDFWEDNKVWSRLDFGVLDRSKIWSIGLNRKNPNEKNFRCAKMSKKGLELWMCFSKDQHKGEDERV